MEYFNNILAIGNEFNDNQLLSETPIGWSSICFDQTISYYIECNSNTDLLKYRENSNQ